MKEERITRQMIVEGLEKHFGKHNYEAFAERAERGQDLDLTKSVGYMVDGFVDNCGVSAGFRTVYYDVGYQLYSKFLKAENPLAKELAGKDFDDVMGKFSERYTQELNKYDISMLEISDYVEICKEEIACNSNKEQVEALCYGTWLVVEDYFRFS